MKKVLIFIATIIMCVFMAIGFTACNNDYQQSSVVENGDTRFVVISEEIIAKGDGYGLRCIVVYDKETLVMYAIMWGQRTDSGVTMTMLVNEKGEPLLWQEK